MSATHAYYSGDTPGLVGAYRYSCGGRGTIGSQIPSSGDSGPSYLYASLSLPDDANKEYYGVLGALPSGLTLAVDDNGAITASASDGSYTVPFDLYEDGVKLGSTSFALNYGVVASTVNLVGANSTQGSTSSTGAAAVTRPGGATVNLAGANASQTSASSTGVASVTRPNGAITVPDSRTAVFAAKSRVAVFTGTGPVGMFKVPTDQLYFVGDFTKDCTDANTTAQSVVPASVIGLTLLEGPTLQGPLCVMKIGALDTSAKAVNSITLRVTLANGEVVDGTMNFTVVNDRSQQFGKDPDDQRFYALDVSAELVLSTNTTIATVQQPAVAGVSALTTPVVQGGQVVLRLGGLDTSNNATNSCALTMTLATTEVITRTIYFSRQDH